MTIFLIPSIIFDHGGFSEHAFVFFFERTAMNGSTPLVQGFTPQPTDIANDSIFFLETVPSTAAQPVLQLDMPTSCALESTARNNQKRKIYYLIRKDTVASEDYVLFIKTLPNVVFGRLPFHDLLSGTPAVRNFGTVTGPMPSRK